MQWLQAWAVVLMSMRALKQVVVLLQVWAARLMSLQCLKLAVQWLQLFGVDILDGIDDIHFAQLTSADVVRHRLVSDIVDAYAKAAERPVLPNRAHRRPSRR